MSVCGAGLKTCARARVFCRLMDPLKGKSGARQPGTGSSRLHARAIAGHGGGPAEGNGGFAVRAFLETVSRTNKKGMEWGCLMLFVWKDKIHPPTNWHGTALRLRNGPFERTMVQTRTPAPRTSGSMLLGGRIFEEHRCPFWLFW